MFANNAFLKVWKAENKGKYTEVRGSTSRKKEDGTYEQDFSGFVRLVGKAHDLGIKEGDTIQMLSVGVTSNYVKEKETTYTNFLVFDAKVAENKNSNGGSTTKPNPTNAAGDGFMNIPDGIDDELPFS